MYPASADFHAAVKNGNPQMPLLIFPNAVFTAEDIDVNAGIEFDDLFNTEDNISIGQALMNNIRFTLFNDKQLLNDYEFGQFIATIGVQIAESTYTQDGLISISSADNTYVATSASPYLTRNGSALASSPAGKLANIIIYDGKVYAFRENGFLYIYDDATGDRIYNMGENIFDNDVADFVTGYYIDDTGEIVALSRYKYITNYIKVKPNTTYSVHGYKSSSQSAGFTVPMYNKNKTFIERKVPISASSSTGDVYGTFETTSDTEYIRFSCGTRFTASAIEITENVPRTMPEKFKRKLYYGAYFDDNILTLNQNGVSKTYEFVPLGTFLANRPDAPSVSQINMSCDDQMKKFDRNLPDDTTLGITYPTTIGNLYKKMCEYLGVPYETDTFINSTATIAKRPSQFESVTMRTVLQWIAEAAGSNAKFNRDGVLCLLWLNTTTAEFDEGDYSAFSPFWYETQQVDKLYNRNSQGGDDGIYGSGNGGYLILDNPLMKGAN